MLSAAVAVWGAGCSQSEPIREYTVAKPPMPGAVWFFKLIGPDAAVTAARESFRSFVDTVRFDERSGLPSWTLPKEWTEESSDNSVRYKTLKLPGDPALEVAVTQVSGQLPLSPEDVRLQVNMLREQVGLPTIAAGEESTTAAEAISLGDHAGTWHEFSGTSPRFGPTRLVAALVPVPIAPRRAVMPSGSELPLAYTAPAEWKPGKATQFSLVSMTAGEGDSTATITITQAAGRPLDNVNRWRGQAGLEPVDEAGLVDVLDSIETNGLHILSTAAMGAERAILGAMIPVESGQVYFVKLDGRPDRVNDERERFRKFLESFRPTE